MKLIFPPVLWLKEVPPGIFDHGNVMRWRVKPLSSVPRLQFVQWGPIDTFFKSQTKRQEFRSQTPVSFES